MNKNKQKAIIVDIDGTLALLGDRSPYDTEKVYLDPPNKPIIDLVWMLHDWHIDEGMRVKIILLTGREDKEIEGGDTIRELTMLWLLRHDVIWDELLMRSKGDNRQDTIVKKEIYDQQIKQKYDVLYVIEDRRRCIDMWRAEGLTVLDVAGNDF